MKKKLIALSFLLVFSLVATYLTFERPSFIFGDESIRPFAHLQFDQLKKIIWPEFSLEKKGGSWVSSLENLQSTPKHVSDLLLELQNVRCERETEFKEEFFQTVKVPLILNSMEASHTYILGDVSKITGAFYLKADDKTYLCRLDKEAEGFFKDEVDMEIHRYLFLKDLFNLKPSLLLGRHLPVPTSDKWSRLIIDNKKFGKIELDIKRRKLIPHTIKLGLRKIDPIMAEIYENLQYKEIFQGQPYSLSELMSTVTIISGKEQTKLELYRSFENKMGFFININQSSEVYEMDFSKLKFFFYSAADFYLVKLYFKEEWVGKEIHFHLPYSKRLAKFVVKQREPSVIISSLSQMEKEMTEDLSNIAEMLVRLNHFHTEIEKEFDVEQAQKKAMQIEIGEETLYLKLEDVFVLTNLKKHYQLHISTDQGVERFKRILTSDKKL